MLTGPSDRNFREIVQRYERAGALRRVRDGGALAAALLELEADPVLRRRLGARAGAVTAAERGALVRLWEALLPLLPPADES